ncbi:MAG TPA: hypothetical protein VMW08_05175 [Acidimicrobiales bacterium]|nr:hypothetical protein [Acidimicrobiales bacterium]
MWLARRVAFVTALALSVVVAACGGGEGESERPDVATWEAAWTPLVEAVPAPPADRDACESYLASIRAERENVFPSPSESLDSTVTEWIDKAEQLTFDCDEDAYAEEFDQLGVIEEEIDAGIAAL